MQRGFVVLALGAAAGGFVGGFMNEAQGGSFVSGWIGGGENIDASISVVGVGFILGWEDKKFRFKIDPLGWFGFDISIDFGQIFKDIFGWVW